MKEGQRNDALAAAIKAKGYNQRQFAEVADISQACVSHLIQSGSAKVQRPTAHKVCTALGMTAADLKLGGRFWREPVFKPVPVPEAVQPGLFCLAKEDKPVLTYAASAESWKPQYYRKETGEWVDLYHSLNLNDACELALTEFENGREFVRVLHRESGAMIAYGDVAKAEAVRCG